MFSEKTMKMMQRDMEKHDKRREFLKTKLAKVLEDISDDDMKLILENTLTLGYKRPNGEWRYPDWWPHRGGIGWHSSCPKCNYSNERVIVDRRDDNIPWHCEKCSHEWMQDGSFFWNPEGSD